MEKEDTVSVQWAQEDVETSYSLVNNNNSNNNNNNAMAALRGSGQGGGKTFTVH